MTSLVSVMLLAISILGEETSFWVLGDTLIHPQIANYPENTNGINFETARVLYSNSVPDLLADAAEKFRARRDAFNLVVEVSRVDSSRGPYYPVFNLTVDNVYFHQAGNRYFKDLYKVISDGSFGSAIPINFPIFPKVSMFDMKLEEQGDNLGLKDYLKKNPSTPVICQGYVKYSNQVVEGYVNAPRIFTCLGWYANQPDAIVE
jgi:hypothetical protein